MKQFMFIFRGGDTHYAKQSPEVKQKDMQKWFTWIDQLKKQGNYVSGMPLEMEGKIVHTEKTTDGPFAEGKELIGGFFIVKANSLDEASNLANDCPSIVLKIEGATVEVRPVMEM